MGTLSRALRLILAAELAVYVALVWRLHIPVGWPASLAIVVGIGVALRALPILLSYLISLPYIRRVPSGCQVGPGARLRGALQEVGTALALYTVLQPFERLTMPRDAPRGDRAPVLLVHGYLCNRAVWWSLARWLSARGHPVFTVDLEPVFGDIDRYAPLIARRIEEACALTGASTIALIGGSMGGLAIRAYRRAYGAARVAQVITLGTPHHGSVLARLAYGDNGRQMRPGSAWLADLAKAERGGFEFPFVSVYSCHDNLVAPPDSSLLQGADNRALGGVGHLSLAFSPAVRDVLSEVL